jgi:DNA-binding transcriptional LysR family regulator
MNEFADIRAFVHVADTGSFSAAARLLGISKSVITKRINELERALNAQLLQRSTRRVALTDVGASYRERCARILADLDDANSIVTSVTTGLSGLLRVSCIASFAAKQLCADLRTFHQRHPKLVVELHHNDRIYNPILEGYDLCIQPGDIHGDAIVRRPIVTLRRQLLATPDYLARHDPITEPEDLSQQRIAHNNFIQPGAALELTGPAGTLTVPIRPVVLTNSIWMLLESILHGDCIGILPVYYVPDELLRGELIPVLPGYDPPSVTLSAYYRRSTHLPLKTRLFLDFLVERYKGIPPWELALQVGRAPRQAIASHG